MLALIQILVIGKKSYHSISNINVICVIISENLKLLLVRLIINLQYWYFIVSAFIDLIIIYRFLIYHVNIFKKFSSKN